MSEDYFKKRLLKHIKAVESVIDDAPLVKSINLAGEMLVSCINSGGRIFLCGNGGSAADCQHIAAELTGRFLRERKPLPAESLTTNTSSLTAIANDYGYQEVFRRQVEALGRSGDVLMGFSTSGNSENIALALERARELGLKTIGLTGDAADTIVARASDCLIAIPTVHTPNVQEAHILIGHLLCEFVDDKLFNGESQ